MIFVIECEDLVNHESLEPQDIGKYAVVAQNGAIYLFETHYAATRAHDRIYLDKPTPDWDRE